MPFKIKKEYVYNKSLAETLKELQDAFERIGKVRSKDIEKGTISGKTRFGLQSVQIEALLEEVDGKTKIIFQGKSDDIQGIGAQKGIERLFETMQNLDNAEFIPSKSGITFGQVIANIIAFVVALVIGFTIENIWISAFVLAVSVFLINYFYNKFSKDKK